MGRRNGLEARRGIPVGPERGRAVPAGTRAADQHAADRRGGHRRDERGHQKEARDVRVGGRRQAKRVAEQVAAADEPGLRGGRRNGRRRRRLRRH